MALVAVKRATTGDTTTQKLLPLAERRVYDSENDCAIEVSLGRADAFVYDKLSIIKHVRKHAKTTRAILVPFNKERYGIAVRKGDSQLLAKLNAIMKRARTPSALFTFGPLDE